MNDNKFEIIGSTLLVRMGYFILEVMNQNRPRVYIAAQHVRGITGLCLSGLVSTLTQLQRYQNRLEIEIPRREAIKIAYRRGIRIMCFF